MDLTLSFAGISPGIQALIILSIVGLLLGVSCKRGLAMNLVAFLRDLLDLLFGNDAGNRHLHPPARVRSRKRSRVKPNLSKLGRSQGEQAHEQQRNT